MLPTRYTRFATVLTTNPSMGMSATSIPAAREAGQSPITIAGWPAAGGWATTVSVAPVVSRMLVTSSSTILRSAGLGCDTAMHTIALATPSRTSITGSCLAASSILTGIRSRAEAVCDFVSSTGLALRFASFLLVT